MGLFDDINKKILADAVVGVDPAKPGTDATTMTIFGSRHAGKSIFVTPPQKSVGLLQGLSAGMHPRPTGKPIAPEYLVWSPGFGLRFARDTGNFVPGTYKRVQPNFFDPNSKWYLLVRKNDRYGRKTVLDWVEVSREQLPKQIFAEALLLDIQV